MARKILLADDSVTAQNMGRKILADAGYEVITVNNGSAALKKIAELKPDLIVLDVYMPGYSGLEVCQRVKDSPDTSRTPVLLTVGKLEPFKPEEARRVRAEGFIIKPFEASELLSALSKLEDKIVPRAEASKSGRFARANAAIEEGPRADKNAGGDEDSGWKNRIAFPVKKKAGEESEEQEGNGREIYNAMNKDLRTVVDHEPSAKSQANAEALKAQEDVVDLSALAVHGLPADVTSEEIAALAAAAAQVKSKIAELESAKSEPAAAAKTVENTAEPEASEVRAREVIASRAAAAPVEPVERVEPAAEKSADDVEPGIVPTPSAAEVQQAIASLEQSHKSDSEAQKIEPAAKNTSEEPADVPVTMAVATGAAGTGSSRWMAIPVSLAAEESSISLEQEMQKAHAAFASVEAVQAESAAPGARNALTEFDAVIAPVIAPAIDVPKETIAHEPVQQVEAATVSPVVAPEPTHAVAKAFETVAAARVPEPGSVETSTPAEQAVAMSVEAKDRSTESPDAAEPPSAEVLSAIEDRGESEVVPTASQDAAAQAEEATPKATGHVVLQNSAEKSSESELPAREPPVIESSKAEPVAETTSAKESLPEESSAHAPEVAVELNQPVLGGDMVKKESEIAATTAAAWASWRQIRETGDTRAKAPDAASASKAVEKEEAETPRDGAAMAVAAGAENRPAESADGSEPDPEAIASIVDSVLAQMRPKIVEEISRKMGKKQ